MLWVLLLLSSLIGRFWLSLWWSGAWIFADTVSPSVHCWRGRSRSHSTPAFGPLHRMIVSQVQHCRFGLSSHSLTHTHTRARARVHKHTHRHTQVRAVRVKDYWLAAWTDCILHWLVFECDPARNDEFLYHLFVNMMERCQVSLTHTPWVTVRSQPRRKNFNLPLPG